eukprot:jgi/Bigna1/36379/e_gw1.14.105.1
MPLPDEGNCSQVETTIDGIHTKGTQNPIKLCLTQPPGTDGFGAHYTLYMTAIAFAAARNVAYCHTRNECVGHHQDADLSEILIGLDAGDCTKCNRAKHGYFHSMNKDADLYYTPCVRNFLRKRYQRGAKQLKLSTTFMEEPANTTVIAVHIRRGDVSVNHDKGQRYVKLEAFERGMQMIRSRLLQDKNRHVFHIFSEGEPDDFELLAKHDDVKLQLLGDDGMFQTFHSLANAEYLITSPSSFSYAAGILSTGKVDFVSFPLTRPVISRQRRCSYINKMKKCETIVLAGFLSQGMEFL